MSGQIHADFLRFLCVLADKQMRLYYGCMAKKDKIGNEMFQWARAKAFNSNKASIGRVIAFDCATRCHLSVHSLTLPHSGSGDDSRGGGNGTGWFTWGQMPYLGCSEHLKGGGGSIFLHLLSVFLRVVALIMVV